jgi:hypothetical protein
LGLTRRAKSTRGTEGRDWRPGGHGACPIPTSRPTRVRGRSGRPRLGSAPPFRRGRAPVDHRQRRRRTSFAPRPFLGPEGSSSPTCITHPYRRPSPDLRGTHPRTGRDQRHAHGYDGRDLPHAPRPPLAGRGRLMKAIVVSLEMMIFGRLTGPSGRGADDFPLGAGHTVSNPGHEPIQDRQGDVGKTRTRSPHRGLQRDRRPHVGGGDDDPRAFSLSTRSATDSGSKWGFRSAWPHRRPPKLATTISVTDSLILT